MLARLGFRKALQQLRSFPIRSSQQRWRNRTESIHGQHVGARAMLRMELFTVTLVEWLTGLCRANFLVNSGAQ